jgi:predicted nucleic acid-binding protein
VIADTTFLIHFLREQKTRTGGPAQAFLESHRNGVIRTTSISIGEIAIAFPTSSLAWAYFRKWTIYHLHRGVVEAAADVDRHLSRLGNRLGENDNWIAGFCRYYREPVISLDLDFDRVEGLRRLKY